MFQSVQQGVYIVACLVVLAYALWRGGWPERLTAAVVAVAWRLSWLVIDPTDWDHVQEALLAVDAAVLAFLCWLVWRSDRRWPVFAAGFQLQAVLTHVAIALGWDIGGWLYVTALWIWFGLMMLSLGVGTFLEVDRPRLSGNRATSE